MFACVCDWSEHNKRSNGYGGREKKEEEEEEEGKGEEREKGKEKEKESLKYKSPEELIGTGSLFNSNACSTFVCLCPL